MPYEFVTKERAHVCDPPDPRNLAVGDVFRCAACGRTWLRAETFWLKRPYWA